MVTIVLICAATVLGVTGIAYMFNGDNSNFKAWLGHRRDLRLAEHARDERRELREDRLLQAAEERLLGSRDDGFSNS